MWSAHYRAYGQVTRFDIEKIENPLRFQGQYFDPESGLHYHRHRYYNPQSGRYLTPDPLKGMSGLNGYRYAPNPTGRAPSGLSACHASEGAQSANKLQNGCDGSLRDQPINSMPPPTTLPPVPCTTANKNTYPTAQTANHLPF